MPRERGGPHEGCKTIIIIPVVLLYFASVRSVTGTICVTASPRRGGATATSPVPSLSGGRRPRAQQLGAAGGLPPNSMRRPRPSRPPLG